MLVDHFPPYGIRLRTPRLELRLPTDEELAALADVAAEGVHDPAAMPFTVAWTDLPPAERARSVVLHHWAVLGRFTAAEWTLPFTVFVDGEPVGQQSIDARRFAVSRQVGTGSWLGKRHHGRGIGTEMRAAVLEFAFTGLGAEVATSSAFTDNPASLAVSRKLGYRPDGTAREVVRDRLAISQRLRLTREDWAAHRAIEVSLDGVRPCLPLLCR